MRKIAAGVVLVAVLTFLMPESAYAQGWGRCESDVPLGQDYAAWAGPWAKHGASLNVRQDGCGALSWRTYQPCPFGIYDGVCDPIAGNEIGYGGKAVFSLDTRIGPATSGRMLARTAAGTPPNYGIVLRLKGDGTLGVEWDGTEYRFCRMWDWRPACGA